MPRRTKTVRLHFSPLVALVDHTTTETLLHYVQDFSTKDLELELVNWDHYRTLSDHDCAARCIPHIPSGAA